MTLEELRKQIDEIDDRLAKDFTDRMRVCEEIAAAKRETGKPIMDPARERQKLDDIAEKLPPELEQYGTALWSMLFELSRSRQSALDPEPSPLRLEIQRAMAEMERLGLVHSQRTAGRFVTEDEAVIRSLRAELAREQIDTFLAGMRQLGYDRAEIAALLEEEGAKE